MMNKKLQVFVSSTYTDLIEERQAAVEAILDAGHIPAGMELFKAGKSQMKTIQKWIDESDVYMLILGGRYGSIEKESGLSYTELEYTYALSKNMPVFAIILSETFLTNKITALGLYNVLEQNAPEKYNAFKTLVMTKIVEIVDDSKDIKLAIHKTLKDFIDNYDLIGWIRAYSNTKNLQSENKAKSVISATNEHIHNSNSETTVKKTKFNLNLGNQNNDEFDELLNKLQNTLFDNYIIDDSLRPFSKRPSALNIFIQNYNKFCTGIRRIYTCYGNDEVFFKKICPLLKKLQLIQEININNFGFTILISEYGKSFYQYLKSRNYV